MGTGVCFVPKAVIDVFDQIDRCVPLVVVRFFAILAITNQITDIAIEKGSICS
jgi:hypothetical protein